MVGSGWYSNRLNPCRPVTSNKLIMWYMWLKTLSFPLNDCGPNWSDEVFRHQPVKYCDNLLCVQIAKNKRTLVKLLTCPHHP